MAGFLMMKTLALTLSCILLKWPNILQKYYGVHTARFSKYVLQFSNIMHEVRKDNKIIGGHKNESKKNEYSASNHLLRVGHKKQTYCKSRTLVT